MDAIEEVDSTAPTPAPHCGLIVACIEWILHEVTALNSYCLNPPYSGILGAIMRFAGVNFGLDVPYIDEHLTSACRAARRGSLSDAISLLQQTKEAIPDSISPRDSKFPEYLDDLATTLSHSTEEQKEELRHLWYEMIHAWRTKGDIGTHLIVDVNRWGLIEWAATLFLTYIGLILPITHLNGDWKGLPDTYFLVGIPAVTFTLTRVHLHPVPLFGGYGLTAIILPISIMSFRDTFHLTRYLDLTALGVVLIGWFIAAQIRYKWINRHINAFGPFACLWVRHEDGLYDFVMQKQEGAVAWHYRTRHPFTVLAYLFDSHLGISIVSRFRLYDSDEIHGKWRPCYPALVSARMEGIRRRNPVDWEEAKKYTPGLTEELADEFFANPPSPIAPDLSQDHVAPVFLNLRDKPDLLTDKSLTPSQGGRPLSRDASAATSSGATDLGAGTGPQTS